MATTESTTTLLTEQKISIHMPIHKVFTFISNMENFKLWFPEVLDIVSKNDLEHGTVGKTYIELVNLPPQGKQKLKIEVKKVEVPKLYVTESEYQPLLPRMTITLKQEDESFTYVNWKMESRNNNDDFVSNILPNFKMIINNRAVNGLKKLKEVLESK